MDADIALILLQDGIVNGAVYAILALSLVLVFAVTRVILIPMGELVAFGGLTDAALQAGRVPGSLLLLGGLAAAACLAGAVQDRRVGASLLLETVALPGVVAAATLLLAPAHPGPVLAALLSVAIVAPMAAYLYRIAFEPLARASVLVLLIASVGVHLALNGLGLVFFGPEGFRAAGFSAARFLVGGLLVPGQALWIVGLSVLTMAGLALFFARTLTGKALRATAINRLGARLVGISTALAGRTAFALAGLIGATSGVLIVPLTTLYYDSGFLIGLKGFVAAIIAGLASYPVAAGAALLVGCVESFSSFYASAFKEVIVFTIIIPVLLWRSLRSPAEEEE
ncbi:MAG: branched-chain amino acid ABC transporter permease [Acetobacteraceae bacterium]|nr:branched-chain amino acid ABC transporter permease [Acetobacteraceae bacterium]